MPLECIGPLVPGGKKARIASLRLDLGKEQHLAPHLDPQIRGLARFAHQLVHRLPRPLDHLGAAQEGCTNPERPRADVPKLARFLHLDHSVRLQGLKRTEGGGDSLPRLFRQLRKRLAGALGKMLQQEKRPVQGLDSVLVGLVVEGFRPTTRFLCHLVTPQ